MKRIAEDNERGRNVRPRTDEVPPLVNPAPIISAPQPLAPRQPIVKALHMAAMEGNMVQLRLLAERTQDIDVRDNDGMTALYYAVAYNNIDATRFLLEKGAKKEEVDKYGSNALHVAALNNSCYVASMLIDLGVDVNVRDSENRTPMHDAATEEGSLQVLKLLCAKGADINAKDNHRETPLDSAAENGYTEIVEFLVSKGANINEERYYNAIPLDRAIINLHKETAKFLLSKGAIMTDAIFAAVDDYSDAKETLTFLQDIGCDINKKIYGHSGISLLNCALGNDNLNDDQFEGLLRLFISHKAHINSKNEMGSTPLHRAAHEPQATKFVIENGGNVNSRNEDGKTLLGRILDYNGEVHYNGNALKLTTLLLCAGATFTWEEVNDALKHKQSDNDIEAIVGIFRNSKVINLSLDKRQLANEFVSSYPEELFSEFVDKASDTAWQMIQRNSNKYGPNVFFNLPKEMIKEILVRLPVADICSFLTLSSQHDQQTRQLAEGEQRIVPYSLDVAERRTRETYPAKLDAKVKLFTEDIERRRDGAEGRGR